MGLNRRLGQLEARLDPQDKLRALLDEAHSFGSFENYLRYMTIHQELPRPLEEIGAPLAWGMTASRTERNVEKARALVHAHERALFRYFLHKELNLLLMDEARAPHWQLLALGEQVLVLADRDDPHRYAKAISKDQREAQDLDRSLAALEMELTEYLQAAETVSERYFPGTDVLFPELRERLDTLLAGTKAARALLAELLPIAPGKKVDRPHPGSLVQSLVAESTIAAQAAALETLGRSRQADRVRRRLTTFPVLQRHGETPEEGGPGDEE